MHGVGFLQRLRQRLRPFSVTSSSLSSSFVIVSVFVFVVVILSGYVFRVVSTTVFVSFSIFVAPSSSS